MTRGKYATRAENNRSDRLQAEVDRLRSELEREKGNAEAIESVLRREVADLKRDILTAASELAQPEIERRMTELRKEQENLGLSIEAMKIFMARFEYLVFNACRYVSMTRGKHPVEAMELVMTWITGQRHTAIVEPDKWLAARGLPPRGWIAAMLGYGGKLSLKQRKQASMGRPAAYPLDEVEVNPEDFITHLHPDYRAHWYPMEKRPANPEAITFEKGGRS